MLMDRSAGSQTSWLETKGQTRIKIGKLPTRSGEIPINNLLTANHPGGVWDNNNDPFAEPTNHAKSILLHIRDPISGDQFLIDTVAEVSVVPPTSNERSRPRPTRTGLVAANGSPIKSFGTRQSSIKLNNQLYSWKFHIADVHQAILGADFLQAKGFLVDLKRRRIIQPDKLQIVKGFFKEVPSGICSISKASSNEFAKLLHGRAELITPTFSLEIPKHGVQHHIVTHGPPVHAHPRRLPQEKLKLTKEE